MAENVWVLHLSPRGGRGDGDRGSDDSASTDEKLGGRATHSQRTLKAERAKEMLLGPHFFLSRSTPTSQSCALYRDNRRQPVGWPSVVSGHV